MENFINAHLGSIIIVVVLLIVAAVLCFVAKGRYRKYAKQILLTLVIAAEKKFGGGTGEVKFASVVDAFYDKMPVILKILFTEKEIANMIEEAVDKMKEILANNPDASLSITGEKDK